MIPTRWKTMQRDQIQTGKQNTQRGNKKKKIIANLIKNGKNIL